MSDRPRTPPLTRKRLDGLTAILGVLDIHLASGWEGTPYETEQASREVGLSKDREALESAIIWLNQFVKVKEDQKARAAVSRAAWKDHKLRYKERYGG